MYIFGQVRALGADHSKVIGGWGEFSACRDFFDHLGPVVQSPISTNPGLTLNKTYRVNPGLALIGL